jgi:hypothetical protein
LCGSSEARKRPTSWVNMEIFICIHVLVQENKIWEAYSSLIFTQWLPPQM